MFKATRLQVATYLLGVCPFSIAFLVFLNSSVSFVITDLIGQDHAVGNAVGNLGFADELVALVACPVWGLLSDRIGLRFVCVSGFLIISVALALFVQAKNVYPQLLLARLFFSIGGAAASTMVTAILPAVAESVPLVPIDHRPSQDSPALISNGHVSTPSITSELTITPARFVSRSSPPKSRKSPAAKNPIVSSSTSRIAGFVGMFTGCGALIALALFLPLPARFQYAGLEEKSALRYSFYLVAVVALVLAVWCFFGLRHLHENVQGKPSPSTDPQGPQSTLTSLRGIFGNFATAFMAGFQRSEIAMGYLGGFVARASSVGISLFIPLLVNALFLSSGLCETQDFPGDFNGLPDIKRKCPRAYVVAAELTGVTEMVALIFAPVFGYWTSKTSKKQLPLLVASAAGVIGYPLLVNQFDPDEKKTAQRAVTFLAASLIGISQIGAIVCSLGTLSTGILLATPALTTAGHAAPPRMDGDEVETDALLQNAPRSRSNDRLSPLKGSVAGVYSFYGGAAILILTKVGGLLFDKVSVAAPFHIMAVFNAILMLTCTALSFVRTGASDPETGIIINE